MTLDLAPALTGTDFRNRLRDAGFELVGTGGGCTAMVRAAGGYMEVITDHDGNGMPEADDWLWCRYDGDWLADADALEIDSESSDSSHRALFDLVRS